MSVEELAAQVFLITPEITGAHAPGEAAVADINAGNDMIFRLHIRQC